MREPGRSHSENIPSLLLGISGSRPLDEAPEIYRKTHAHTVALYLLYSGFFAMSVCFTLTLINSGKIGVQETE
jgi:hypothetical protein